MSISSMIDYYLMSSDEYFIYVWDENKLNNISTNRIERGMDNRDNNHWLLLEKYGQLVRDEKLSLLQDMKKSEITNLLSLPNFYFPIEVDEAGQIYLGVFGDIPPHEHFEIFNAKSCILSIPESVLIFENK